MKIFFEPNLKYQQVAIDSVVKLFNGVPYVRPMDTILAEVSANILDIRLEDVFKNYDEVIRNNDIDCI